MSFKGIIFDLDGTLLDTLEDLADAMNCVLQRHGYPTHSLDQYRFFIGGGMQNLVSRTMPQEARQEEILAQAVACMKEEYGKNWAKKTRPYSGVPELLEKLQELPVKTAILSNKLHEFTLLIVERYFPEYPFALVRGEQQGIPRKPDPAGALLIAQELGLAPENIVYVGDSNTDMQAARAAGMYAVGVTWGFRPAQELLDHGAQALIHEPLELLEIIS